MVVLSLLIVCPPFLHNRLFKARSNIHASIVLMPTFTRAYSDRPTPNVASLRNPVILSGKLATKTDIPDRFYPEFGVSSTDSDSYRSPTSNSPRLRIPTLTLPLMTLRNIQHPLHRIPDRARRQYKSAGADIDRRG